MNANLTALPCAPAATSAVAGFRMRMRQATRPNHDQVEALFDTLDLTTRAGLGCFLAAQSIALKAALREVRSSQPEWAHRFSQLTDCIARDLDRLGWPRPAAEIGGLGGAHPLGIIYVIAGSRLGAAILHRKAIDSADPAVRSAQAYLAHAMPKGAWAALCRELDDPRWAPFEDDLIAGAQQTFDVFGAAFDVVMESAGG